jgi:hypothetical protein
LIPKTRAGSGSSRSQCSTSSCRHREQTDSEHRAGDGPTGNIGRVIPVTFAGEGASNPNRQEL